MCMFACVCIYTYVCMYRWLLGVCACEWMHVSKSMYDFTCVCVCVCVCVLKRKRKCVCGWGGGISLLLDSCVFMLSSVCE